MAIKSWEGAEGLEVDTDYDLVLRASCEDDTNDLSLAGIITDMEGVHYADGEELEVEDVLLSDWIGQYLAIVDLDGEVAACGPIVDADLTGFKDLRADINELDEED